MTLPLAIASQLPATSRISMQVGANESPVVADLVMQPTNLDLVLTGAEALAAGRRLMRRGGPMGRLAFDRRRYAGARRTLASAPFDGRFLEDSAAAAPRVLLSDSGYVAAHDRAGLRSVLSRTAALRAGRHPELVAVLPLARSWLTTDLPDLLREVTAHGVPVAVALENAADPLSSRVAQQGLVDLVRTGVGVEVLGCDVSSFGAVAFGATAGAVGVRPPLRHFTPVPKPGKRGGFAVDREESALLGPALSFVKLTKLALGVAALSGDPMWTCWCSTCLGRSVDWLLVAPTGSVLAHNVETVDRIAGDLLAVAPAARPQAWRARCASAVYLQESVAARMGRVWSVPPSLRSWQRVV